MRRASAESVPLPVAHEVDRRAICRWSKRSGLGILIQMSRAYDTVAAPISHRVPKTEDYVDIDRLQSAAGIVALISQRRKNGRLTYSIFREWTEPDGQGGRVMKKGAFIPAKLVGAHMDMLKLVSERFDHFRRHPDELPFPLESA